MALSKNQPSRGTQHSKSPADEVQRTGRDSFLKPSGSRGVEHTKDAPEVSDRKGRDSGVGQPGGYGIGRGSADSGGGDAKRLKGDGVGKGFPSP